jgi:antitoxin MazE6
MKTAISLPDDLFRAADALARKLGMSRSRLFASALAEYIARHRTAKVTERLNAVYGSEPSRLDKATRGAQRRGVAQSEW